MLALQGLDLTCGKQGETHSNSSQTAEAVSHVSQYDRRIGYTSAGKLFVDGKNLFKLAEKEWLSTTGNSRFVWQNNCTYTAVYDSAWKNIIVPRQLHRKKKICPSTGTTGTGRNGTSKERRLNNCPGGEATENCHCDCFRQTDPKLFWRMS